MYKALWQGMIQYTYVYRAIAPKVLAFLTIKDVIPAVADTTTQVDEVELALGEGEREGDA
jgi:hypothetical protein